MATAKKTSKNKIMDNFDKLSPEIANKIRRFNDLWEQFVKETDWQRYSPDKFHVIAPKIVYGKKDIFRDFAIVLHDRANWLRNDAALYVDEVLFPRGAVGLEKYREEIEQFIDSKGKKSCAGGLYAIFRIHNNLHDGFKSLEEVEWQGKLFNTMGDVLEELLNT